MHTPGKDIDEDNPYIIDELPLDYSILDEIDYVYPDSEHITVIQPAVASGNVHSVQYGGLSLSIKNIFHYRIVLSELDVSMESSRIFC